MKKLKKALQKVIKTSLAKKAPLTKKKSAPVKAAPAKAAPAKAAKKKAPAKAVVAKKAAPPVDKKKPAAKPAPKKAEPVVKGKKVLAVTAPKKAAPEKGSEKVAAKSATPAPIKTKKAEDAPAPKAKVEAAPKPAKADKPKKTEEAKVQAPVEPEASAEDGYDEEAEVFLTDAEGRRYCRVKDCDQVSNVDGYCRYHYLLYWKNIQVRKKILTEGKLERYIEELTARYPDKYLEMLRKDLRTEKDFTAAITELELDESAVDSEYEDEAQSYLDEVRGVSGDSGGGARDDDGDF